MKILMKKADSKERYGLLLQLHFIKPTGLKYEILFNLELFTSKTANNNEWSLLQVKEALSEEHYRQFSLILNDYKQVCKYIKLVKQLSAYVGYM